MARQGKFESARFAFLSLAVIAALTIESRAEDPPPRSCRAVEPGEKDLEKIKLPGIDDFTHGLDYSTGRRLKTIFKFTYDNAEAGDTEFLHTDSIDGVTYMIPDQVDAMDWASVCSTLSSTTSTSYSNFRSYQEAESKSVNNEWDQKTDISVAVPVGDAEVGMSTQTENNLGYGKSSSSSSFSAAMVSGQRTAARVETFNSRWAVQWKDFGNSSIPIDPRKYFTDDFKGTMKVLESKCMNETVNMAWRMKGHSGSNSSDCEQYAASVVENFGTHYNKRAEFGGKASQSYHYNEDQMTTAQADSMQENSKNSMGFLFFSHDSETESSRDEIVGLESKNVVSESQLLIIGGDAGAATAGEWCSTVSKAPVIVGNSKVIPIADLLDKDSVARAALVFAGIDKWVCNGRGTYVNIDKSSGAGSCKCNDDHDFYLDEFCAPKDPKCYDGSTLVDCQFEKILVTYALSYTKLYSDKGSKGSHDGSLWKPQVAGGKGLIGTVALKGYSPPTKPVVTIDTSTSSKVARAADSYEVMYKDTGTGAYVDGSVWRPKCPSGYTSVSDFGQSGHSWPGSMSEPKLPCIADRCVKKDCYFQWVWSDVNTKGDQDVSWWRIAGTNAELGSDVGGSGGFFRAVGNYDEPSSSLHTCLKSDCVVVV